MESTFFVSTFFAALVTVSISASTILPCPANGSGSLKKRLDPALRSALSEEDANAGEHAKERMDGRHGYKPDNLPAGGLGQRAYLTRRGGWIEIDERPPLFSWRRWTSLA